MSWHSSCSFCCPAAPLMRPVSESRTNTFDVEHVVAFQQLLVRATRPAAWAALTDVARWPAWMPEVSHAQLDGPLASGVRLRWEMAGVSLVSTVTEIVPYQRIRWSDPASPLRASQAWRLCAVRGGVLVGTEESWAGAPAPYASRLRRGLDACLLAWLQHLKTHLEAA